MGNYKGRRPGTRRIVLWKEGRPHEWILEGTKAEGAAFAARKRVEIAAQRPSAKRGVPTFSDFCVQKYRPHAERHLKASTWKKVRIYQLATLEDFFGKIRLDALSSGDVEDYKAERLLEVQASSINNELRVFRTVLNWAVALGCPVPVLTWKKLPTRGTGRVKFWHEAELDRLFQEARAEAPPLLALLVFLANTGCRKGEAIAAEWSWMDFERGMVRIPSSELWQPKDGDAREVPMSDAVRALLSGPRRHPRWVFANRHRRPYRDFPKDLFWAARDRAGLSGGVHTLRHSFASHFLAKVPDLFLLAQVLGHSHEKVTELYAHLLPDHLSRARNAVNLAPSMALTMAGGTRPPRKPDRNK